MLLLAGPKFHSDLSFVFARANPSHFSANPLSIAKLSVWIVFDIIYVILSILCLIVLRRLPVRNVVFSVLFGAILCTIIQSSLSIAYTVRTGIVDDSASNAIISFLKTADGLHSSSLFFMNWAVSLLFLSLVLLLVDRQKHINRRAPSRIVNFVLYASSGWFTVLLVLGTVVAGLNAAALSESRSSRLRGAIRSQVLPAQQHYEISCYIQAGVWFCTALWVSGLAACVYATMWRTKAVNWITVLVVCIATPLYTLGMLELIIFSVAWTPLSALGVPIETDPRSLVEGVLFNVFRSAIFAVLLVIGFKQKYWRTCKKRCHCCHVSEMPRVGRPVRFELEVAAEVYFP